MAKCNYTKEDFLKHLDSENIIDLKKLIKSLDISLYTARGRCKQWKLKFRYEPSSNVKTRQCPCCSWSGNFQFAKHIVDLKDEEHKKWIDKLISYYKDEKLSPYKIAKKIEYKQLNISKTIIRDILDKLNIRNKKQRKIHNCPVEGCEWQDTQHFTKHLKESIDVAHEELKESIIRKYVDEKMNPYMVGEVLGIDGTLIKGYLENINILRTHKESVRVSMDTGRHNIDAYGISGRRQDLNNQHFRSIPEANFARILEYEGFQYETEKRFVITYPNGNRHDYHLDFLIEGNEAREIKSYIDNEGNYPNKEKIELFRIQYLQYNFKILFCNRDEWKNLEIKYKDIINHWETQYFNIKNENFYD